MHKLTTRQAQILDFLEEHMTLFGAPPTRVEIANKMGFRSPNAAEDHLRALNKKGAIELIPGTSRGIRIIKSRADTPLIGKVAAGMPILAQENIESYHRFDRNLFNAKPDYLLTVTGDSMINAGIFDGDYIAVKSTTEAVTGQIVVARIEDEVTVKRIKIESNKVVLTPENPDYEDIVIFPESTEFAVEGKVVGVIRSFA